MFDIFYIGKKPTILNAVKVSTISEAQKLSRTRFCWIVNYLCDYSTFDFLWEPVPWESNQRHAWASQWQVDSETYLVPKNGYTDTNYQSDIIPRLNSTENWEIPDEVDVSNFDFSWHPSTLEPNYVYQFGTQWQKTGGPRYVVPGATVVKYLGELTANSTIISNNTVYLIDHENTNNTQTEEQLISVNTPFKQVVKTRFISSYLGTLKRIIRKLDSEYVWVTSSLCDYSNFDFSWHPEKWQGTMLHVFPSNEQKFGDTFLINVKSFNDRIDNTELLEWYDTINFVSDINVPRWDIPIIKYDSDNLVDVIKKHTFTNPFIRFIHTTSTLTTVSHTIPMWREKTRTVLSLSEGNADSIIPRDAKNHIKTQVYDYPFVSKKYVFGSDTDQDIIFISYDEIEADKNWKILHDRFPRAKRVHGVKGMDNALKEAATISDTEWYYAVFAKTQVHNDFDFSFKPDRFQQPKHYIFNAKNVLNGLEYGHMGIVLYNSNIILGMGDVFGIDYTLSAEHEVIPILSANATFNASPYQTWRTAFRECSKLAQFNSETPSMDSEYRLQIWKTKAEGKYAEWCLKGANDGVEYFNNNANNPIALKKAFDWEWLHDHFNKQYKNLT